MVDMSTTEEDIRVSSLKRSGLISTQADPVFRYLVDTVSVLFEVPIAAVTLIDDETQWFKESVGLNVRSTPRTQSFCSHAIQGDGLFIIPDTYEDDRFRNNPLVTGSPFIRSYAGIPISNKIGQRYGALCIIDTKPRRFDRNDLNTLGDLKEVANKAIELHEEGRPLGMIEREIDAVLLEV